MSRFGIWIANGILFALCCFLVASIVNDVVAEWLEEAPGALASAPPPPASPPRSWQDRQVILTRNLFNVSTLAPAAPSAPEEEELEATKLPVELRGTVASENPALAWAAVEDTQNRRNLVVRVNDRLLDRATVVRIERRRIVLDNSGRREELALAEGDAPAASTTRAPRTSNRLARVEQRREEVARLARVRQLAEDRFAVPRSDVEQAARNPAQLFSQARILPKYESGQMVGVQLNSIKPGSLFEQIGLQEGDTITELNGIAVTSPQESASLLRELTEADRFTVIVTGPNGQERTLNYEIGE